MVMRGGTSKGVFLLARDLPIDPDERDRLILDIVGSPDARQIDGIGGAHPLTTKVAVIDDCADDPRADVGYLFLQPGVDTATVSTGQNCGNILAAVGQFAVERGLIRATGHETRVRILMRNTASVATATFPTEDGLPRYDGDTAISGVPGTAAEVRLDFVDIAGGSCGALLPTGNAVDDIDGIAVTLIDNGMPVVVMRASDLGVTGHETCAALEADAALRARLEAIRLTAGPRMGLGDVTDATVPKLTLVAEPRAGGHMATRTFIPHRCHDAIGVLGAVSVATAALLPGTPAASVLRGGDEGTVELEHPTGDFAAAVSVASGADGSIVVARSGIIRTARKLMDGTVFPRTTAAAPAGHQREHRSTS